MVQEAHTGPYELTSRDGSGSNGYERFVGRDRLWTTFIGRRRPSCVRVTAERGEKRHGAVRGRFQLVG